MKAKELRQRSLEELRQELVSLGKEAFNLRMRRGGGQTIRPHLFKMNRRDIARIKTLIQEQTVALKGE